MTRKLLSTTVVLTAVGLVTIPAMSQRAGANLLQTNPSFELPQLADGDLTANSPGWGSTDESAKVLNNATPDTWFDDSGTPDGQQAVTLGASQTAVFQYLENANGSAVEPAPGQSYQVTFQAGRRSDGFWAYEDGFVDIWLQQRSDNDLNEGNGTNFKPRFCLKTGSIADEG
jgi:hypothetical protein